MEIRQPKTPKEFFAYYDLRWRVLRKPWNQPRGSEKDDLEDKSIHIIAVNGGKIIGCGRLHFNSLDEAQVRFVAVEESCRGKGVGRKIMAELEKQAKKKGAKKITLNCRDTATEFYKKLGYKITGDAPKLFGCICHFRMEKVITFIE